MCVLSFHMILQLDEHSLCCLKVSRMVEDDIGKKNNLLGLNNQLRGSSRYPNICSNEDLCLKVQRYRKTVQNVSQMISSGLYNIAIVKAIKTPR